MTAEKFLLADIGGTNSRFAYGNHSGILKGTTKKYRNDDHAGFLGVLNAFLAECPEDQLDGVCIAIAGPVSGAAAKLTNRPWEIERDEIAEVLGTSNVKLVNDICALGCSINELDDDQIDVWRSVKQVHTNGQSLVIGIGTGINVSARTGQSVLAAEVGHSSLTDKMAAIVEEALGEEPRKDQTIEDFLSGRGLEHIYLQLSGSKLSGEEICKATSDDSDPTAHKSCALFAKLGAEFIREVSIHYLPRNGIYMAGSVSRGMFNTPFRNDFVSGLLSPSSLSATLQKIPVSLINDDAAALRGCLEIAKN